MIALEMIRAEAFAGSNAPLVAPVHIGDGAYNGTAR
jgi:bifunctional N-acetylglucosamine-1-phosphate-uridyltransferase/glucosamine-1-phosphate-acetyltransferase GlmU-like protein